MEGWLDLTYPQIHSYLIREALGIYEQTLGSKNTTNHRTLQKQLQWGREYVTRNAAILIPKGCYTFTERPQFQPTELIPLEPVCEMVFFLTNGDHRFVKEEDSNEEQLLMVLLQTAFMDGARKYLSSHMLPTLYQTKCGDRLSYVSPCFGPGLFSTDMTELKSYFSYLKIPGELARLQGERIVPLSSFIGAIYGLRKPFSSSICGSCKSHHNCQFCMNRAKNL